MSISFSVSGLLNTCLSSAFGEVQVFGNESVRFDSHTLGLLDGHVDGHLLVLGGGHGDVGLVVISLSINRGFGSSFGISVDISVSFKYGICLDLRADVSQDSGIEVVLCVGVQRDSVNGSSSNKS